MRRILLFFIFTLLLFSEHTLRAETITISIAASMTDVFKELISEFATAHPEHKIRPNFGSSGSLAKQIEQGAPVDVFISANPDWVDYLIEKQAITSETKRIFAHNRLVFIGPRQDTKISLADLSQMDRIAIGNPKNVPAGQYAREAMVNAGVYQQLESARKLVMAKDVRQALLYADRGEADGAFVYSTDARLVENAIIHFIVDSELHSPIVYPLCLTVDGYNKTHVRLFYDFLKTNRVLETLNNYGFETTP